MRVRRLGPGALLALLTLLAPAKSRAACTKDSDCSGGFVCVRDECVRPVDPGSTGKSTGLRASERKRAACLHRCDQANSKCQAAVQSVNACIRRRRESCADACVRAGSPARDCSKKCRVAETSEGWAESCSGQGDAAREACVAEQRRCITSCGTSG